LSKFSIIKFKIPDLKERIKNASGRIVKVSFCFEFLEEEPSLILKIRFAYVFRSEIQLEMDKTKQTPFDINGNLNT